MVNVSLIASIKWLMQIFAAFQIVNKNNNNNSISQINNSKFIVL